MAEMKGSRKGLGQGETYQQLVMFGGDIVPLTETYINEHQLDAWELTERQKQIVRCICLGMVSREIGARLGIERGTVNVHVERIFLKTHVTRRNELIVLATRPAGTPMDHGLRLVS